VTIGRSEGRFIMKYRYLIRSDVLNIKNTEIKVYGIDVYCNNEIVKSALNLFSEKEEAEKFAGICNELELDIVHFDDVVLDLLKERELYAVM